MTLEAKVTERIVREQAKKLGGTWRMEQPVVMLTMAEADTLIEKMEKKAPHDGLLAVRYIDPDDKIYILPPDRVEFVYDTDGI